MNSLVTNLIKIISASAIAISLGLQCQNIYLNMHNASIPSRYQLPLVLSSMMLIAHSIEGLIAALKASRQQKNPLAYGFYTFFVGFPGLQELDSSRQ